jgi:hypothetical protein
MRIDARADAVEAARWKLVRTDTYTDIAPGAAVLAADDATGEYRVRRQDGSEECGCRGPGGLRLAPRAAHVDR